MQFVRFLSSDGPRYALVEGTEARELDGDPFSGCRPAVRRHQIQDLKILPPCSPSKILALALNYPEHASEVKQENPEEPQVFFKPPSSIIAPGEDIILPSISTRVGYEAELAVIIKDATRGVPPEKAMEHVLGYTCVNDVSARDFQRKDRHWWRAKGFDTFCPLGPYITTDVDPHNLKLELYLNGQVRQSCNTGEMLFKIPHIIAFLSRAMTLLPGDIICTGTCAGTGALAPGDEVEVRLEKVGSLRNRCRAEG
ncbi:MAG: fumarylacetoacetate hydrolase family protein [Chloroflexi bacterium]|nr:fumarylacetoacetate hydrolase family protein [Chloroflexota bacterium]